MPVTRILHRAGNLRTLFPLAHHPAIDAFEADVWVRGDRLVLHHDRPLGTLPLLLGPWRIHGFTGPAVSLGELLESTAGHVALVLDLRSWFGDPAPDLARALMAIESHSRISVTCEDWSIADRLRGWLPDLRVGYSVRSAAQLRRYEAELRRGERPPTPIAIRHTLLAAPADVTRLRAAAGQVTAWTIDDVDRAIELAGWGVDAIVSNRLTVLNAL